MKNKLSIFENKDFGEIRTVIIDGEPWFVGKDVAGALGYEKERNAVSKYVDADDALKWGITDSLGREQQTIIINESGLYALIFGSKLEKAKAFKRWITSEVLPILRKTGTYAVNTAYQYPLPAATFEAVANLGRLIERTMKAEGACPQEIAIVLKSVFCQSGIEMQDCFIKIPAYEQLAIMNQNGKLSVI